MAKKILIIEGDQGFSTILSEGLNNHSAFSAVVVPTAAAALKMVTEKSVDLVIVDLGMQAMPAVKLIQALKKAKAGLPVMVTPALGQPVPDDVQKLAIEGIVPKPFFVGDLPKLVGEALGLELDSQEPALPDTQSKPAERKAEAPPKPRSRSRSRRTDSGRSTQKEPPAAAPKEQASASPAPAEQEIFLPTLPSWKLERLRKNKEKIIAQLDEMNQDFRAEVILLTAGSELIARAGTMNADRAQELSLLVARGAEAASQAASFLGERAGQFEQSLHEGSQYRLYSYSLGEGIVLSLALSASVPLGILRHQTRRTSQTLIKDYIS